MKKINSGIIAFCFVLLIILTALVTFFFPDWDHSEKERVLQLADGKAAYVAFAGEIEFVLVSDTNGIIDKIDVNVDTREGVYTRTGDWSDTNGVQWKILYSVSGENSIAINGQTFFPRLGRIFVLDSNQGVIQFDDSGLDLDVNLNAEQIKEIISGDRIVNQPSADDRG